MLKELNEKIQKEVNILEIVEQEKERYEIYPGNYEKYQIRFKENKYIRAENHVLNVTEELQEVISEYFKSKGKEVEMWNNTGTFFYIKN